MLPQRIPDHLPYVVELVGEKRTRAGVITPTGYGLYDLAVNFPKQQRRYGGVWQARGSRPVSAGLVYDVDGDGKPEFLVGGRDGFLTVLSDEGKPIASRLMGGEVRGIAALGRSADVRYIVATDEGLRVFDSAWREVGREPGSYATVRVVDAARRHVLAITTDGRLRMLRLDR